MISRSTITQQYKGNAWHTQPTNGSKEREIGNHLSSFHSISGQSQSLIIWILIAASVIFAVLGESVDVFAVVLLNAIIVFFQEFNVEKPQHSTLEDDRPPQQAATRNAVNSSGGAIRLIGQQPAD
jgi:magnesium-transporting ATPase (P-type)